MPWPNRLEDGNYVWEGRRHQLPLTEPERGNAIHGLVRELPWRVRERDASRVVLAHELLPQPGYPFSLALTVEYALSDEGLLVRTTATNVGTEACPFGCGAHPYLTVGTTTVDSVELRVPGRTVLLSDERGLPVGSASVEEAELDFRLPRPIGETVLDHAFTDLERDADGLARRPHALGRRDLPLPDAVHRRPAPRRRPQEPRRRADDLPAERVHVGRVRGSPRAGRRLDWGLGHRA
jgi:aldose 1-epimerase